MNSFNPIRKTPLKWKPKQRKESAPWHPQVIRLDSAGMAALRSEAFRRSGGICECGRAVCRERPMNLRRVTWYDGILHHVIRRGRSGSDVIENVQFITRRCHEEIHGVPQWSMKRKKEA